MCCHQPPLTSWKMKQTNSQFILAPIFFFESPWSSLFLQHRLTLKRLRKRLRPHPLFSSRWRLGPRRPSASAPRRDSKRQNLRQTINRTCVQIDGHLKTTTFSLSLSLASRVAASRVLCVAPSALRAPRLVGPELRVAARGRAIAGASEGSRARCGDCDQKAPRTPTWNCCLWRQPVWQLEDVDRRMVLQLQSIYILPSTIIHLP